MDKKHVYCRYCGRLIDDDAPFCTYCGKAQFDIKHPIDLKEESSLPVSLTQTKFLNKLYLLFRKSIWKNFFIGVTCVIVVLGLILLGDVMYYKYHKHCLREHYKNMYTEGLKDKTKTYSNALILLDEDWDYSCENAIELLTTLAEKGDAKSQVLLGRYYKGYSMKNGFYEGWKSNRDIISAEKSTYWYFQAAHKGNAEAQGELGHNYEHGFGVQKDMNKAIYWIKKGADGGNAVAQWRMGHLYWSEGIKREIPMCYFIEQDLQKAKYYWNLSAKQGFKPAKESLEKIYEGDN